MSGRLLERDVLVRCGVAHAFAVFTDRIDQWWPRGHRRSPEATVHLEARPGGRFVERHPEAGERELGEVLACEPPERLVYTWWPGALSGPTEVEVRFAAEGERATRVRIVHREAAAAMGERWPERAALFTRGWGAVLPAFAAACADQRDEE